MPKFNWIILALFLSGSEAVALAFAPDPLRTLPAQTSPTQTAPTADALNALQLAQRGPRPRLGGRDGGMCVVSPGLLEAENAVWSDRPLFLWQIKTEGITPKQLAVIDQDGRIIWEKALAPADQSAIYTGQALQPGQFYQWRLEWTVEGTEGSTEKAANYTFQVMASDRRDQIAAELQALTRQLQASGASATAIIQQQADYLIEQEKPLWSDALKLLYTVENPSAETVQKIEKLMNDFCGEEEKA